ncbi:hypothetical protein IFM47457_07448 [Aspergillus lentulus]|nr:hypothetical protein IFM47457_07448 [Aspergillus lentulus]
METTEIPPNDAHGRRWLLDREKWEIQPYARIPREILDSEGYGVVSYTLRYIADSETAAADLKAGLSPGKFHYYK